MELTLSSFAKINLVLRILNKRKDGYHNLETIFQTIDLHDRLTFRFRRSKTLHLILNVGDSPIPADSANLVYKACHAFHRMYPIESRIEVVLDKQIPVESGLGGGSSNAAVTLIALSQHFNRVLDRKQVLTIARSIGADVPFFFYGGTALGRNRGDRITQLADAPFREALLVYPEFRCPTRLIYDKFDELHLLTPRRNFIKIHLDQRPESLKDLDSRIENDLEQVVFTLYPELDSIKRRLLDAGAVAAALSGSGSTVYGLFKSADDRDRAARDFPNAFCSRFLARSEYKKALGI
jgi:4-diphosphocytidyl-2-C-methyl-D-erythritol kinase